MIEEWEKLAAWWTELQLEVWCLEFHDTWAHKPASANEDAFKRALRWIDEHEIKGDLESARAELRKKVGPDPKKDLGNAFGKLIPAANLVRGASKLNPDPEQRERFRKAAQHLGMMNEGEEWNDDVPLASNDAVLKALESAKTKRTAGAKKLAVPWQRKWEEMAEIRKLVSEGISVRDAATKVDGMTDRDGVNARRLKQLFEKKKSLRTINR